MAAPVRKTSYKVDLNVTPDNNASTKRIQRVVMYAAADKAEEAISLAVNGMATVPFPTTTDPVPSAVDAVAVAEQGIVWVAT